MRSKEFFSECVNKWRLDELTQIIDRFESDMAYYVKVNHVQTAQNYPNMLLFTASKSILTCCSRFVLFVLVGFLSCLSFPRCQNNILPHILRLLIYKYRGR